MFSINKREDDVRSSHLEYGNMFKKMTKPGVSGHFNLLIHFASKRDLCGCWTCAGE